MKKGLSVVIPNYNGVHLFPHTLPTVYKALQSVDIPWEIIVVDDCSTDHSIAFLQERFPDIITFSNSTNSGFSISANKGIVNARYSYVLLLNSDVKLDQAYFQYLFSYFDDKATFGVAGRVLDWDGHTIQDGAKYPVFHGAKLKTSGNYILESEQEMEAGIYSIYLSGACALFDREKLLQCGGFNELFSPFYVEDYELCIRAWRLGWKCFYDHRAICYHKVSTSIKKKNTKRHVETIYNRNKMFLHAIHLSPLQRLFWFIQLIGELLAHFFTFRWSYLQSFYLFMGSYKEVRLHRVQLERLRRESTLLSINQTAALVINSTKGKKIRRF